MRKKLVRLVALVTLFATAGCGGGGGAASNPTTGANSATVSPETVLASMAGALMPGTVPAGATACTAFPCTLSNGYVVNVTLPASFVGITATANILGYTQSGQPANPSEVLTVLAGTITLSAPPPANGSPTITITSSAFPVQNFTQIDLIILTNNGGNIIPGTENSGSASIPSYSGYVWPGVEATIEIGVFE